MGSGTRPVSRKASTRRISSEDTSSAGRDDCQGWANSRMAQEVAQHLGALQDYAWLAPEGVEKALRNGDVEISQNRHRPWQRCVLLLDGELRGRSNKCINRNCDIGIITLDP